MTGLPGFNYGAFRRATEQLRSSGWKIHTPTEIRMPGNKEPGEYDWKEYMRWSLGLLLECDGIILLPGWVHSEGAVLEFQVAKKLEMEILHYDPDHDTAPNSI